MAYAVSAVLSVIAIFLAIDEGAAQTCAPITDKGYSKEENKLAKLVCEISKPTKSGVQWLDPSGRTISTNCRSSNPKFTVKCTPPNNPTKYTLVFNASWTDRGTYACVCQSTNINSSVVFTVKVPPKTIQASCIVKDTGKICKDTSRKGSDVLEFKATVGCAAPSPTITWMDDLGNPIKTSNYGGIFKKDLCIGDKSGQSSVVSMFSATWSQLEKPGRVNIAAANDVGGTAADINIHKEPEKEDTTVVVIAAVIGVVLFLIIMGMVVFLIVRYRRRGRNTYV